MKQGQASSSRMGSTKTEPRSTGINPAAAAEIGIQADRTRPMQMYEGRGIEAPRAASTIHHSGSQGKHR